MSKASKAFWIVIVASAFFTAAVAKEKLVNSTWCAVPLRIDGTSNDWRGAALAFEKKVQADFTFMNDADYLYILFIFNDLRYLSSIDQTGMTVYFNVEGKKKKVPICTACKGFLAIVEIVIPTDKFAAIKNKVKKYNSSKLPSIGILNKNLPTIKIKVS